MTTERPSGTVTFLFTDIEGSTSLWEKHPAAMASALERHDAIVRGAIEEHGGHVFATGGDGFGVAFERAEVAVRAAVETQRRLVAETWPLECRIAVRMGVHSGETTERAGDYFGSTVNRCARIMSIAHAGQILVSELTRSVVLESGLGAVGFEPCGTVVLRGTDDRVTLYRAVADGIPVLDEPLLRATREGNVVPPPTSFVGREHELADLLRALDEQPLVTLIGVGGVGKTRLAIEAALEARGHADGVWMVELGPINDADQVADALSDAIGLRPTPGVSADQSVVEWCSSRHLLVVLDNCEHVLRGVSGLVSSLLTAAPAVTVLATSREPLMVRGEHVMPVPSLSLESSDGVMSEAVGFFSERARAELPGFDPDAHADAVLEICTRLDGIPLALELAAARVRGLSVPDIARRLDERFRLLTGGRTGSVERHATLRAAVAWSHDLLDADERDLFERLSVFAGRFNVDDAVGLCGEGADEFEVIDTLTGLVDRSLVVREDQQPEYRMLETLRAFGREQLVLNNRIDDVRGDHATLMAAKAKESRRAAVGPSEPEVVALLEAQMADYGVAADWAIGAGRPELAVAMAEDCLFTQWSADEPGTWVAPLVESENTKSRIPRALALTAHHALFYRDAIPLAIELAEAAIAADPTISLAHQQLCVAGMLSGRTDIVQHGRNALDTAVDDNERAGALLILSHALLVTGRPDEAARTTRQLEQLGTSRQYHSATACAQYLTGELFTESDPARALSAFQTGLATIDGLGFWVQESNFRRDMIPLLMRSDPDAAITAAADFIARCDRRNDTGQANNALAYLATILDDLGEAELAAAVVGRAGETLLAPFSARTFEATKSALRDRFGDAYEDLTEEGSQRPTLEIMRDILAVLEPHR